MQIVIDIDKEFYEIAFSDSNHGIALGALQALRRGIVLPEKHGRLIDADAIEWYGCTSEEECLYKNRKCKVCDRAECSKRQFDSISPIIEATEEQA